MSIHDGHRQRLKDRFLRDGLDGFTETQILELLLFYAIPMKDTNPLAHRLLDKFGSLARVLDAPVEKLMQVDGVSSHTATLLKLGKAMGRCYEISKVVGDDTPIRTVEDCAGYMQAYFRDRKNEMVVLLALDAKLKVLECREIGEGSVNYASVPIRRVVEMALESGASMVVLAHNHPSGIATPSGDDIYTTRRLAVALQSVDIQLVDHIVVADGDYVSMVQSGYYNPEDCKAVV